MYFESEYSINFHFKKKKSNIPWRHNLMKCAAHASAARAVNLLATDFFFRILAHPVFKM